MTIVIMALFLLAIVAANLSVAAFGQAALPITAFVLIPFDLVTRDLLHERWNDELLWVRMFALIATGSLLSFVLAPGSSSIAVASTCAFALAGVSNAVVYHWLNKMSRIYKMNISNAVAACIDSLVFPAIAFTAVDYNLSATQAGSKFIGGLFWTLVALCLLKLTQRKTHAN
tara:strand:- start:589 stop:1104 length:516 start_codon:yes stop_codon:yes gene_type:complete